jgi:copper chaperone CopZ
VASIGHDTKNYRATDSIYKALPACCKYERAVLSAKPTKYQTVNLLITGMTCAEGCAKGIELKIYQQNGVKFSEVNYEKQKAKIVYDPTKISLQKIIQLIVDFKPENGEINKYEVTVLP